MPAGPVDGQWGQWEAWSECDAACGSSGSQFKVRSCDSPRPQHGGAACEGKDKVTQTCEGPPCPNVKGKTYK